jgi:hypothetical protein
MNVHQKINVKGNAVTHCKSRIPVIRIIQSKKYEVNITSMLLPKQWKTNYKECHDLTRGAINY